MYHFIVMHHYPDVPSEISVHHDLKRALSEIAHFTYMDFYMGLGSIFDVYQGNFQDTATGVKSFGKSYHRLELSDYTFLNDHSVGG
jgi:hypothetical protein